MCYSAKRDGWLTWLLVLNSVVLIGIGLGVPAALYLNGTLASAMWVMPVCLGSVLIGILVPCFVFSISYELSPTELVVRAWPFGMRIPLAAIEEVRLLRRRDIFCSGWKLSPSLDRLHIRYRKNDGRPGFGLIISPRNKEAFVRQMVQAVPSLKVSGQLGLAS